MVVGAEGLKPQLAGGRRVVLQSPQGPPFTVEVDQRQMGTEAHGGTVPAVQP